jgi:hypothetical protein
MKVELNNLTNLIIGFRFEKSFRIGDISGSIIDAVLHDKQTPFGTTFFNRYKDISIYDRSLLNEESGNFLRITASDIIFKYNLSSIKEERSKEIKWIKCDAVPFIMDKILIKNKLTDFIRVGCMMTHLIDGDNIGGKIIEKLTGNTNYKADQFSFSFGLKEVSMEALVKKVVNDYTNRYFIMKQVSNIQYEMIFDYQYFFEPYLQTLGSWKFDKFFEAALSQVETIFYPFVNSLIEKTLEEKSA